jgi:hypothetical protein
VSRSWKDAALDGPRSPKYTRSRFKYTPEEQEVDTVYIIANEWREHEGEVEGYELVGAKFFLTEDEAWDALSLIAESCESTLHKDDTSFEPVDSGPNIEWEEYRIEELARG